MGWELVDTTAGRQAFYRIIVLGKVTVFQHGRIGTRGVFDVFQYDGHRPAVEMAIAKTRTKAFSGNYLQSVEITPFLVPISAWRDVRDRMKGSGRLTDVAEAMDQQINAAGTRLPVAQAPDLHALRTSALGAGIHCAPAVPSTAPAWSTRMLTPVGATKRPNGEIYRPRQLGGHEDVAVLRQAQRFGDCALLMGPPGTGKTALVEAAFPDAEQLSCSADTQEADLVGSWMPSSTPGLYSWAAGPLQRSLERNVPLFIDEIALADTRVFAVLYSLMDGRDELKITTNPGLDPIRKPDRWILVGAFNPEVPGAQLSDALRSRFRLQFEVNTDFTLARELGVPADLVSIAENLDTKRQKGEISWSPQLRELLAFRSTTARYGDKLALNNLVATAPPHDRDIIIDALSAKFTTPTALRLGSRYGK